MTFEEWFNQEYDRKDPPGATRRAALEIAWDAAVKAERERCALVADRFSGYFEGVVIGDAIRGEVEVLESE